MAELRPFKIVTQLDSAEPGGVIDDCAPASLAALANYLTGSALKSREAIAVATKCGRIDRQGKPDGSSLALLVKMAPHMGLKPRWAKSWAEVLQALADGHGVIINVQQPIGYPMTVRMSAWHAKWAKWWQRTDPKKIAAGYGHATAAVAGEAGAQWACPTMSGTGSEAYAVPVSLADLKTIASSKGDAPHKRCLIMSAVKKPVAAVPASPVTVPAQVSTPTEPQRPVAAPVPVPAVIQAPVPAPAVPVPAPAAPIPAKPAPVAPAVDTAAALNVAAGIVGKLNLAAKGDKNMGKQIVAAALDALQAAVSTAIAVFLGMGISIFDLTGEGAKAVVASAVGASLMVLQRWLDEDNTRYGRNR